MATISSSMISMRQNNIGDQTIDPSDAFRNRACENITELPDDNATNEKYRRRRKFQPKPPSNNDLMFIAAEFLMYHLKFIIYYKLLEGYYRENHWTYFTLTLLFFAVPVISIQIISCKWFFDDGIGNSCKQCVVIIIHMLMLGPALRCCYIIWYGVKYSRNKENINKKDYIQYTAECRDNSLLRCIRAFWADGAEAILHLYVLLQTNDFTSGKVTGIDLVRAVEVIWATLAMTIALVSYKNDLRIHKCKKGYSLCAYISQCLYRLLFISSRILAITLFIRVCHVIIVAILLIHVVLIMVCWIRYDRKGKAFFPDQQGKSNECFESFFQVTLGVIHVYCYMSIKKGIGKRRLIPYSILFVVQNALMYITWMLLGNRSYGIYETIAVTSIIGFPLLGIIFLLLYYAACHPTLYQNTNSLSRPTEINRMQSAITFRTLKCGTYNHGEGDNVDTRPVIRGL